MKVLTANSSSRAFAGKQDLRTFLPITRVARTRPRTHMGGFTGERPKGPDGPAVGVDLAAHQRLRLAFAPSTNPAHQLDPED